MKRRNEARKAPPSASAPRPDRATPARARFTLQTLFVLLLLCLPQRAWAVGDPDLSWWTIETAHFRVHYERGLEPVAERVASIAETVHDRLTGPMGYAPSTFTEIVLTDDTDSANGSATSLPYNTVRLFVTAPDDMSPLGDYDDWYLALITHEYTHILHTDNISGVPAIVNAIIGKTLSPNQVQPRWIIEGLAVYQETAQTSGGRLRASLFDMFMRADVMADHIASLDQISSGASRYPQGNLYYLYGSQFLGWISAVYGPDTMRAVSADYGASVVPWGINRAIRRVTGRTYVELYDGFKDALRLRTNEQLARVSSRGVREGSRLTYHGQQVSYPRFVPKVARREAGREELLYYRNDLHARAGLYRVPLGSLRDEAPRQEELVARTADVTPPSFGPRGELYFASSVRFKNAYQRDDLFVLPPGATSPSGEEPERRRLTVGLRATSPDVSPDGRHIVFAQNGKGTTTLRIADVQPDGSMQNARDLAPSAPFDQAYTPRFSPDGRKVAYSAWKRGGLRDIAIVDVATGDITWVTRDRAMDLQPAWSPDQKRLYFSSDRTGIANIYAYDLASGVTSQVTNVRTGAFAPAVSGDQKTLAYVGYTTDGFDLFAMALDPARFLEAPRPPSERPDPPTPPRPVAMKRARYNPLPTLAPRRYSFDYKPGSYGGNALTMSANGSDVVGHHAFGASITVDTAAPEPTFFVDYVFGRLPVDFSARFFHSVSPRGGYRISDELPIYDEVANGATTALSYPIQTEFGTHGIALSYTAASFRGELPVGRKLDPYAKVTVDPPQGLVSLVHFGYGYSNVEGSLLTAGAARGVSFSVGLDLANPSLGSEFSLRAFDYSASAYVPMPWPGAHTLALRSSGAIAAGTYTRAGIYYVGGYDLENNSLFDAVTTGVFNGAFVLRGYPARSYLGRAYLLETAEYRFPILVPDRGVSTLPIFLRRIDGNFFFDYGGAFNDLDYRAMRIFHKGDLLYSPQLHAAVGGELWANLTLGYGLATQLRLGYAYGFSELAIPGGQAYFVAASAF